MPDAEEITPVVRPVTGTIRPPGSKSITNRALILAALSDGPVRLHGVLDSQDTQVMVRALTQLGFRAELDAETATAVVVGNSGQVPNSEADLHLHNSGTSIRFLTALCALGKGRFRLDGIERMRERPIADLTDALARLGADISFENEGSGCPPIVVRGCGLRAGSLSVRGDVSSQFLSSLLMALPAAEGPVTVHVEGELVSVPYVTMTLAMMRDFGVAVEAEEDLSCFRITPKTYQAREYSVEPDASAASYFLAAAAITGGRVRIEGIGRDALQGDIHFADALERMGCAVDRTSDSITVTGGPLRGIDVDMNSVSDTAQTLAVVAAFAVGETRIRGVGHMRHKETDRIAAVVTELRRCGVGADETEDGLIIRPAPVMPASVRTYDDHRMAMSFALLGLKVSGIRILDPGCTVKTYPGYFDDLKRICRGDS